MNIDANIHIPQFLYFHLDDSVTFPMKEEFAKLCFETLLEFSYFKEDIEEKGYF